MPHISRTLIVVATSLVISSVASSAVAAEGVEGSSTTAELSPYLSNEERSHLVELLETSV
ncbi:MAG: hypothetical protein MPN21_26620 [Thermoanaerobaculia bacterium]|nr:hypothetical protein [Thermoanaerobaculia bacterium]